VKQIGIGLAGFGTVGKGVVDLINNNSDIIALRTGVKLAVVHVGARRGAPELQGAGIRVSTDVFDVIKDPEVDICVELMGGIDTAKAWIETALEAAKPVVTANKALIAEVGSDLIDKAQQAGVPLLLEAAVAGGIPILKALREGLSANRIDWVAGIINGTTNYILTQMAQGRRFDQVLKEAQEKGYAEADPTFDVEGIDAAHKLTILAAMAFGVSLSFKDLFVEGVSKLEPEDLTYAAELGYRIKHLGLARQTDAGVELRVHPALVSNASLISHVDGVMNAVMVKSDAAGCSMFYGAGAGGAATASSVVADIVEIVRTLGLSSQQQAPALAFHELAKPQVIPQSEVVSAFYLRFQVADEAGALAHITEVLGSQGISIEAVIQKAAHDQDGLVSVIMLTQPIQEALVDRAIAEVEALPESQAQIVKLRVVELDAQ